MKLEIEFVCIQCWKLYRDAKTHTEMKDIDFKWTNLREAVDDHDIETETELSI